MYSVLVAETLSDKGLVALGGYVQLLAVLIGTMLFTAFVVKSYFWFTGKSVVILTH